MDRLGNLLPKVMAKRKLGTQSKASHILFLCEKYCLELLGEQAKGKVQMVKYDDGKIIIKIRSAAWKQKMHFLKEDLLKHMGNYREVAVVEEIKIQ